MLRYVLAAFAFAATPLAAQSARDTAAIRAAAADSGETVARVRIVADTAWAWVYDWRKHVHVRDSTATTITLGTAVAVRAVRLERRVGKWVAVRFDPKAKP